MFDENGRKFSKPLENTVGKGEIARYEQFLLFPQCLQKTSTADTLKSGLVWERVKNIVENRGNRFKCCREVILIHSFL